ncbi:MAG: inositol-3-phosphate synthase [bacterium]|nr:inositol-3-phosphate synthase [bacterium]
MSETDNKQNRIKVAIVGIGNCASSLIQGVYYYHDTPRDKKVTGLLHSFFGKYSVKDIKFVAAFDIDEHKVGKDLSDAVFSEPNCTKIFFRDIPAQNVKVHMGTIKDSVDGNLAGFLSISKEKPADVAKILKETGAEILLNYLPVGSKEATHFYAEECLKAGVAFINCIPEFIVSDERWEKRFKEKNIPCIGDDIQSQLGATVLHKTIIKLLVDRGMGIDNTYQLNIGGNTDFLNMHTGESRLISKRISKTSAISSMIPYEIPLRIGPSDYIPHLKDNKIMYVNVNGKMFGNIPFSIDVKLSVEDSPNSAGIVIDAIRAAKIALDRGTGGAILSMSGYGFKHPPVQMPYFEAQTALEEFISGKRER